MLDFFKTPELVKKDPYLIPHKDSIIKRYLNFKAKLIEIERDFKSLVNFSSWYKEMGLHDRGAFYCFREWAPNATAIYLIGDFNQWKKNLNFKFKKLANGYWQLLIKKSNFCQSKFYKFLMVWSNGEGERLPSFVTRTHQDKKTLIFSALIDDDKKYEWQIQKFKSKKEPLLIYEAHVGMSSSEGKVSNFNEFRENILPRIIKLGYNTIQLMALAEHPYYGSFGYQVSNFFSISSRFGSSNDLKQLIDCCHQNSIRVIMDLVHSHAVKNEMEGLSRFDGSEDQFFYSGSNGWHPVWDSRIFNYGKIEVLRFLLSNCAYFLQEFKIDGFRFDGITSMIYLDHGLVTNFDHYNKYFYHNQDENAITYLMLANYLIHQINPQALTIAEDISGYPGLATTLNDGGLGFDFRLNMAAPDFWEKILKKRDQDWSMNEIVFYLTRKRVEEKVVSYVESHDQALVGSKTIAFQLMDKEMYTSMGKKTFNYVIDRGLALHKIIRLLTATLADNGYLNFMGNEFGHPEWIDFPSTKNNFSFKFCKRQWNLVDNLSIKYHYLNDFDQQMIHLVKKFKLYKYPLNLLNIDESNKLIFFQRGKLFFLFNLQIENDCHYQLNRSKELKIILNSDWREYGGQIKANKKWQIVSEVFVARRTAVVFMDKEIEKS